MTARSEIAEKLKSLRERAGLSYQAIADCLGMPKSTYASKEDKFKRPYYPFDFVERLAPHLIGKGIPPITAEEVFELAGPYAGAKKPEISKAKNLPLSSTADTTAFDIAVAQALFKVGVTNPERVAEAIREIREAFTRWDAR